VQIEHPDLLAQDLIHKVLGNLKHMQTLSVHDNPLSSEDRQMEPFAQKISLWSLQGDLICSSLYFDNTSAISKIIKKLWKGQNLSELHICHSDFVQKVLQKMLMDYPQFLSSKQALLERITILYKHFWYTDLRSNQESAFDRFIKWHYVELTNEKQMQFHEMIIEHLDDLCKNSLPLIPFQRDYVRAQTEIFQTVEENLSGI